MDILRIATAGNVDDGKSTLIGRLLHDTNSVTKDKLDSITLISKKKGLNFIDLSLLTDGLMAEIEQGITIDVAHIYFSTGKRKYIIADSPGHFEYTRNMITGASNADVFIVLIDAVNGVTEQTRRHLFIASLLCIETVIVCINKMDLVSYSEEIFVKHKKKVEQLIPAIGLKSSIVFIPVAAKDGDNIVKGSQYLHWYNGRSLLEYVEEITVQQKATTLPLRFVVQMKIPANEISNLYAGRILSGKLMAEQTAIVFPSLKRSVIKKIWHSNQQVKIALAGQSVTIELTENSDMNRGDILIASGETIEPTNSITATICWLNEQSMDPEKEYILQHGINVVKATFASLQYKSDIHSMKHIEPVTEFHVNDIGRATIKTDKPILTDVYRENPNNGAFIIIDEQSNNTVAAGFIEQV